MGFADYIRAGWAICGLPRGEKSPKYKNWNVNPVPIDAADGLEGAGLLHSLSGTAALDIDAMHLAIPWLAERGVDLDALLTAPDAVKIDSGRHGRAKLIFRLRKPLRTFKPAQSGLELRCATLDGKSVHDALPPSLHPSGKPYVWAFNRDPLLADWRELPPIPATLLTVWRSLLTQNPPTAAQTAAGETVELTKLQKWLKSQNPNARYDDGWLKVGMKLHHATGGAEEGLALWDEWSRQATRIKGNGQSVYETANCRSHWISFESTPGKVVATLNHELPADVDEFEVITETEAEAAAKITSTIASDNKAKSEQRKAARTALEERLVWVRSSERYFDTKYHKLMGSDSAIEHEFTSMMPKRKSGRINPVRELKQSTTKKKVTGLGFHPGEGPIFKYRDDEFANSYRNRLPKPIEPTSEDLKRINWLFDRIDDPIYSKWLLQFFAHVVQRPAVKIKTAPLIWSETQRSGKSTLLKAIPALLVGMEYSTDVDFDKLSSNFNDYLQNAWHVNLTEFRAGSRGERTMINNKLKAYIADDTISLHPKGKTGYTMPNHFFVTATSNEDDAAAIDANDERWGIHELKAPRYNQAEDQWIYHEFLNLPRAAAVLRHYFLHVSLTGFSPTGSPPMTDAKRNMASASVAADLELLQTMFEERSDFFARDVVNVSEVKNYVHKHSIAKPSLVRIGKVLAKPPFNGQAIRVRFGKGLYRAVIIRNHAKWAAATGHDIMEHMRDDISEEFDDEVDPLI